MTYVKTYLPTLKTHVVNLKREAKDLSRHLQRLEVLGKLGSKTLYCRNWECLDQSWVNRAESVHGTLRFLYLSHLLWDNSEYDEIVRYCEYVWNLQEAV